MTAKHGKAVRLQANARDLFCETVIAAAEAHGQTSEADHEVGDLQEFVRELWSLLTPVARQSLVASDKWQELIADWL